MIDMRSDTVTLPGEEMRKAMLNAPVGDDVFGEDPTVNHLQEKMAGIMGMEAALFCPSGTMANQIAIKVHTQAMDELICDIRSHIYQYEGGGYAFNSGVAIKTIHSEKGILHPEEVIESINPDDIHKARTRLLSLENTVNKGGGIFYTLKEMEALSELCRAKGLKIHLDGARLFNALVETGDRPEEVGALFDTVSICLSKGLGAPVGSVLLGSKETIRKALRIRKVLGGGMRQAGILAAAGIYALDHHIDRLKEDHQRAAYLADSIQSLDYIDSVLPVYTNILVFDLKEGIKVKDFLREAEKEGLLAVPFGGRSIRLVTHLNLTDRDIEEAIRILKKLNFNAY